MWRRWLGWVKWDGVRDGGRGWEREERVILGVCGFFFCVDMFCMVIRERVCRYGCMRVCWEGVNRDIFMFVGMCVWMFLCLGLCWFLYMCLGVRG